ncbi:hypothetical protein [Moraxella ovis]|uniref:hypothetical protein n=1 Tax=Moraxella ovis TaxID=29433 RepID=UPI000E027BB4|nr:hypothetical protein [Moraxella ovis]STZ31529.1 Uncharacterised protein [Moraxella ovis]
MKNISLFNKELNHACIYGSKCYWCVCFEFTADDGTVYNHIKIIALADNKGGYGSVGQSFKYDKPSNYIDEFGFIQPGQVYQAKCKGLFESNGKTASFVIKEIEFINKDGKK